MYYTPLSRGMFIGSRTWPPLHLDAVVAMLMRSESRAAPRAIATVIFSFCFFVMPVFVCRTADRHTRAALRAVYSTVQYSTRYTRVPVNAVRYIRVRSLFRVFIFIY